MTLKAQHDGKKATEEKEDDRAGTEELWGYRPGRGRYGRGQEDERW